MSGASRLLVVGPSWVGDMVMAQSLLIDLRRRNEVERLDVLAPAWSVPLLGRMPEVDEGLVLDVAHGELAIGKRRRVGLALRAKRYDQAIVLPRSAKAALVPFFARIPRRTGFRGEYRYGLINDMRPFDAAVLNQTVKRFRALGTADAAAALPAFEAPVLRIDPAAREALIARHGLVTDRPVVALMPGAEYGPAKQWPVEKFRELAQQAVSSGLRVWVFGGPRESALGERIAHGLEDVVDLTGRTSLTDVVDLLSAAKVAVSNDSGLMHVAAAVGVHVVGIYGSSSPSFTPPLTARRTILYRGLSCSPCFARHCRLGHTDCLNGIGVAEVLDAARAQAG